jgi:hypothetical protein
MNIRESDSKLFGMPKIFTFIALFVAVYLYGKSDFNQNAMTKPKNTIDTSILSL